MEKRIKSMTLQDGIHRELIDDIVSGIIKPGTKLTMSSLAKEFGVSIMPVREALMRLEAEAFITIERNSKIYVNELTTTNLKNILEARLLNEIYLAEKASLRRSDESLKKIEEAFESIAHTDSIEDYLKANRHFHNTIYEKAGVPVIYEFVKSLEVRVSPYLHILFKESREWNAPKWVRNHEGMLRGIEKKDPALVRKWLETDLRGAAERVSNMLDKHGV